jgi:hypothetical protein
MTPLPDILAWVGSHSRRFARVGYTPPNHLADARARVLNASGNVVREIQLDAQGTTSQAFEDAARIEVYDKDGALLYSEES